MMNPLQRRRLRSLDRGLDQTLPAGATPPSWLGVQTLEPRLLLSAVVETAHVLSPGGAAGDQFGQSLDISGDLMIIGSTGRDTVGGSNAGAAQIFQRSGTAWNLLATLTANDATAGDLFGAAVAIDGNFAVVTAVGDNAGAGVNSGSAYVFQRNGSAWNQIKKLTASDGDPGDQFGVSADIDSNRIIIGAFQDDDTANNAGSAYIFQDNGAGFIQTAKLQGDASAFAEFGSSVSISGDFAIVGAHGDTNASGSNAGAAYIFNFNGTQWQRQTKLKSADRVAFDQLGVSVAIDGATVVVGASQDDDNGSASGSAYVFTRSGSTWTQQAKLKAPDAAAGDQFGRSVAIDGDRIAVGASEDNFSSLVIDSGSVYTFSRSGTKWTNLSQLVASDPSSDDNLGRAVAISGSFVAGGANFDDTSAGVDAGSVYVLQLAAAPAPGVTATLFGDELQITGTSGNDVINVDGVSNGVVRVTGSGIDEQFSLVNGITINGLEGNDTITVGNNVRNVAGSLIAVEIFGGDGDDNITGGAGNDVIDGGSGNDTIKGGAGNDNINGGTGNDNLTGEAGTDTVVGGGGTDTINNPDIPVVSGPQVVIGDGLPTKITFVDADGTTVSMTFKGGTATVTFGGTNITQVATKKGITVSGTNVTIDEIALTNTTIKSSLTFAAKGGNGLATVGEITGSSLVGKITGKTVDLIGDGIVFTGAGAVGSVTLHDLLNGADILAPGNGITKGVALKVNAIGAGSTIDLGSNLKSLSGVGNLLGDVTAPVISSIKTKGNLAGSFTAESTDAKGVSIGTLSGVNVTDADINAEGGVKSIKVSNWQAGEIEALWVGSLASKGAMNADLNLTGEDAKGVSLSSLKALTLTGVDVNASGGVKAISVTDWVSGSLESLWLGKLTSKAGLGADLTLNGADAKGVSLNSLKALTITDLDLEAPGIVKSIAVTDWIDGAITAGSLGKLSAKNNFGADLTLTDSTPAKTLGSAKITGTLANANWRINGTSGAISAGTTNNALNIDVLGDLASLAVKNNAGGHFAADNFSSVAIGGNLTDAHFLAGAHLGNDGELGGIGANADTFASGSIGKFSVKGQTTNSIIGAGLDPVDGVFKNGNEIVIGGVASFIKTLSLGGSVSGSSLFAAGLFPTRVTIEGVAIDTATDPRFLLG